MHFYSKLMISLVAFLILYSEAVGQEEKKRLIGSIEQSIAILDALSPYDFVGLAEETNVFGEEIAVEGSFRFRLRVDLDSKEICFGLDSKSIADMRVGTPKCSFRRVVNTISRSSVSDGAFKEERFENHRDAIYSGAIPFLSDCNFGEYPKFVPDPSRLTKMIAQINQPQAGVQVTDDGETTTYALRISENEDRLSFYTWKFLSSEGLLLEFTAEYQYAPNQPKSMAIRQKIFWEEFSGRTVPHLILCESTIVRLKDHPTIKNFGERGLYVTETELRWVSAGTALQKEPVMDLSKTLGVKSYIQDGLKKR